MSGICDTCMTAGTCEIRRDGRKLCTAYERSTNYNRLFGTPERAAVYFAMQCFSSDGGMCQYCPFDDCDESLRKLGSYPIVRDKMLEWLSGEGDTE